MYDDQAGANAAARAWWMLRAHGHDDVAVLDGGLAFARAAGIPLTQEIRRPRSAAGPSATRWSLPTVTMDEVAARAQSRDWKVLDVRRAERYRGRPSPSIPLMAMCPAP